MGRAKYFAVARKDEKIVGISGKVEGKAFLAETTYPIMSVNSIMRLLLALSTCIKTCHNLKITIIQTHTAHLHTHAYSMQMNYTSINLVMTS